MKFLFFAAPQKQKCSHSPNIWPCSHRMVVCTRIYQDHMQPLKGYDWLTIQIPGLTNTKRKCDNQIVRSKRATGSYNLLQYSSFGENVGTSPNSGWIPSQLAFRNGHAAKRIVLHAAKLEKLAAIVAKKRTKAYCL